MPPFNRMHDFLFDFTRSNAFILYRFRVMASHWLKITDLKLPHMHWAPHLGVTPFEFCQDFWHKKTTVPGISGISCGIICLILSLANFRQYRHVTDTQTTTAYTILASYGKIDVFRQMNGKNSTETTNRNFPFCWPDRTALY